MGTEIERKFLVRGDRWRAAADAGKGLRQGYLASSATASVRIRIVDGRSAVLTIKSRTSGPVRAEYEYGLPLQDAAELLALCGDAVVEKRRHLVPGDGGTWEVDVFSGPHQGLVTAEMELRAAEQHITLPDWLGREVTGDDRYSNEALARAGLPQPK